MSLSLAALALRGHELIEHALTAPSDGDCDSAASGAPARPIDDSAPLTPAPRREGAVFHCHIDESGGLDMSVRIIDGGDIACLYCSTTNTAFGPVIHGAAEAEAFLDWLRGSNKYGDPRDIREDKLAQLYQDWRQLDADSDVRVYGAGVR